MHKKLIAVLIGLMVLIWGGTAGAADKNLKAGKSCYRLIPQEVYSGPPGKPPSPDNQHPICKVLLNNLNEYCDEEPPNMVCEFKVHPRYKKQLTVPRWKELDINKNLDKIEAMVRAPWEVQLDTAQNIDYQNEVWQEYYKELKKGINDGTARLYQAVFDLRNVGKAYDVLKVQHGKCTGNRIILDVSDDPKLAIYEFAKARTDIEYSGAVLKKIVAPYSVYIFAEPDIFIFRGRTYSFSWYRNTLMVSELYTKKNGQFGRDGICLYGYIDSKKGD